MLASKTWRYAVVVGLVAMSVCFVQTCLVFWGHDVGEVPAADVAWVGDYESMQTPLFCFYLYFLMPFLAAAVFGDSLFLDVRRRYAGCVAVRASLRSYLFSGALAAFVGGFLVVFIPLLVSQLLAFVAFPATSGQDAYQLLLNTSAAEVDSTGWYDKTLFLGLFLNARYLLNLIFIVYDALWGGLLALAAFALSLYVRTSRLLVVGLPALALIVSSYLLPPDLNIAQCLIFSLEAPQCFSLYPSWCSWCSWGRCGFPLSGGRTCCYERRNAPRAPLRPKVRRRSCRPCGGLRGGCPAVGAQRRRDGRRHALGCLRAGRQL